MGTSRGRRREGALETHQTTLPSRAEEVNSAAVLPMVLRRGRWRGWRERTNRARRERASNRCETRGAAREGREVRKSIIHWYHRVCHRFSDKSTYAFVRRAGDMQGARRCLRRCGGALVGGALLARWAAVGAGRGGLAIAGALVLTSIEPPYVSTTPPCACPMRGSAPLRCGLDGGGFVSTRSQQLDNEPRRHRVVPRSDVLRLARCAEAASDRADRGMQ